MSNRTTRTLMIASLLVGVVLMTIVVRPLLAPAAVAAPTPADLVVQALQRAQARGSYRFNSDVTQVTVPETTLANVGRRSEEEQLHLEGDVDVRTSAMQMRLWSDAATAGGNVGVPESALEVQTANGKTRTRRAGGDWQESADAAAGFAPQGDFLAYARTMKDVSVLGAETRHGLSYTRYGFVIDGPAFARYTRDQLQAGLQARGEIPAQAQLQVSPEAATLTGDGELWIGADGLPLRQILRVHFPPRREARVAAQIAVNFYDFGAAVPVHGDWTADSGAWASHMIGNATGAASTLACLGFAWLLIAFRRRRVMVLGISFGMSVLLALTPVLQTIPGMNLLALQQAKAAERADVRAAAAAEVDMQRSLRDIHAETVFDPRISQVIASPVTAPAESVSSAASAAVPAPEDACPNDVSGDSDGDGLSDCVEENVWQSNKLLVDTDADGINDFQEAGLGTDLNSNDSDGDGINDLIEINGYLDSAGRRWFSDPLQGDSNNDGIGDMLERGPSAGSAVDSDGDGLPDMFDPDNDGDGVPDNIDLSPFSPINPQLAPYRIGSTLNMTLTNLESRLTFLDVQLRPLDETHLRYAFTVLDWPQDHGGQVQDWDNKTFAQALKDSNVIDSLGAAPAAEGYGDMRLTPNLEITIDGNASTSWAEYHLPSAADLETYTVNVITQTHNGLPSGVPIGIKLYVPLNLVIDPRTGARVAFAARIPYFGGGGQWLRPHKMKLVWSLKMLTDLPCDATDKADVLAGCKVVDGSNPRVTETLEIADGLGAAEFDAAGNTNQAQSTLAAARAHIHTKFMDEVSDPWTGIEVTTLKPGSHWRINEIPGTPPFPLVLDGPGQSRIFIARLQDGVIKVYRIVDAVTYNQQQIVQTYDDDWFLTGANLIEEHGVKVATAFADPALGNIMENDETLWALSHGLDEKFLSVTNTLNAQRPDFGVDEIARRFDHSTNAAVTLDERWGISNTLSVDRKDYATQDWALAYMSMTRTKQLLGRFSAGYVVNAPVSPTLLFAQETEYRGIGLDEIRADNLFVKLSANTLVFNMQPPATAPLQTEIVHSVKWTPFCGGAGSANGAPKWEQCDEEEYGYGLVSRHKQGLRTITDTDTVLDGRMIMLRMYHMTLLNGTNTVVRSNGTINLGYAQLGDSQLRQELTDAGVDGAKGVKTITNLVIKKYFIDANRALKTIGLSRMHLLAGLTRAGVKDITFKTASTKTLFKSVKSGFGNKTRNAQIMLSVISGMFAVASTKYGSPSNTAFNVTKEVIGLASASISAAKVLAQVNAWVKIVGRSKVLKAGASFAGGSKRGAASGALFGIVLAWGIFGVVMATSGKSYGDPEFNAGLAGVIAMTIYLVFLAVLSATVVGNILVVLLEVLDAILAIVCAASGSVRDKLGGKDGDCTISGKIVGAITEYLYARDLILEMDGAKHPNLVEQGPPDIVLRSPALGFVSANTLAMSILITTNIIHKNPDHWQMAFYMGDYFDLEEFNSSTFSYSLSLAPQSFTVARFAMADKWQQSAPPEAKTDYSTDWLKRRAHALQAVSLPGMHLEPGINRTLDYWLNMGYALPAYECWTIISVPKCEHKSEQGGKPNKVSGPTLDIFPNTVGEFFSTTSTGSGGLRLAWDTRFPIIFDADGDGLVVPALGGNDPDDQTPDADGDGLTDFYELNQRIKGVRMATDQWDTDSDGLSDAQELVFNTDPANADSDNDGLKDGEEVYHINLTYSATVRRVVPVLSGGKPVFSGGWQIVSPRAGQVITATGAITMWVSSDPNEADGDGDGIPDDAEKQLYELLKLDAAGQPYNPRVANVNPLDLRVSTNAPGLGFVRPGASFLYTNTLTSVIDFDPGVLEVSAPITLGTPYQLAAFTVNAGATTTVAFAYQVPLDATAQTLRLGSTARARTRAENSSDTFVTSMSTEANLPQSYQARGISAAASRRIDPVGYTFGALLATSSTRAATGDIWAFDLGNGNIPLDRDSTGPDPYSPGPFFQRGTAAPGTACNALGKCLVVWDHVDTCNTISIKRITILHDGDDGGGGMEPVIVVARNLAPGLWGDWVLWSADDHYLDMDGGTDLNASVTPQLGLPVSHTWCAPHNPETAVGLSLFESNTYVADQTWIASSAGLTSMGIKGLPAGRTLAVGTQAYQYGTPVSPCSNSEFSTLPHCQYAAVVYVTYDSRPKNTLAGSIKYPNFNGAPSSSNRVQFDLAQNDPFVAVPDGPMRGDFNPSVASDGSGFMVAWNRKEASFVSASNLWFVTSTLMARRYDEYGDALAPAVLLAQYGPHIFPKVENSSIGPLWSEAFAYTPANLASSVIWAGDRYRVTWAYASGELAAISLHGNGGSGALTIPPTLAGNHDRRNPPSVAYDPVHKRIMTTWHGPGNVIAGNLYSITNNTSTSFPNLLDGLSGIHPRIAWNQATRGWLLARDVTNPLGTVRVRALSADGVTSGAPPVVYSAVWPNNGSSTDYSNIGKTFVCPDPASAPVLALAFEELPGATYFADSSGYDNLGICIGAGCPLVGVPGVGTLGNSFVGDGKPPRSDRALQFDGINDNLTFSTQVGDNWAYSFWIKPEASAANTGSNWWEGSMILRNTAPGAVEREFGISMGAGNRILFGQGARSMASQPITLSQWHHVVASHRGTNFDGASVNFLFVDGVSQNATSGYPQPLDTVANMVLGAGSTGFKGSLDFLTLYKTFIDYEYPNNFVGQMYAGTAKDDLGYSENPSYCVLAAPSSSPSTGFPWSKLTIERNLARGAGPLLATDGLAVTVDPIAPTSTIKSLRNDQYVQAAGPGVTGTLLIAGDAFDTGAGVDHVDVLVNGVPTSATGSATWLYNIGLTEGRHSLQSVATDLVGWVETNPQTIYIIADGGPPVLSVLPQQLIPVRNRNGRWPVRLTGTLFDPPVGALTLFEGSGINPASIKVGVRNANGLELLSSPGVIGGDGWQAEVELPASMADPTGIFSVTVSAADNVGNIGTRTGTLRLDVPSVVAKLSAASRGRDYLSSQPALTNCCAVPATNAGNQASLSGTISSTMGLGALEGAFFSIEQTSALSDAVLILPLDNVNNREWFEDATLFQNAARCVSMDGGSECPLLSPNGRGGPAVYFDGGSTLLVSHDDSIDVGLMTDFSIQLWIKTSTPGRTLLSKRGGDPLRGYALQLNDDGRIVFESNGNASSAFGDPLTNNQWHHIAVVVARFPGGVGSGSAKMYIDGDYAGSAAVSDSFENSEALDIGGLSFLANQNFVGFIDHIVIVRRAWSAREVQLMRALPDVVWQPVSFVPALARTRATSPVAGTWTMPLPANLEHFYQLDLRGSDGTGRLFQLSNLWRGVIDNLPPRVTIVGTATGRTHLDPLTGAARYDIETTITARDQYLESTRFNAICNNTSQPVRGYIDEPWRTIAFPDFTLRDSLSYTCHSWATQANPVLSASACDQYGNCATASHSVSTAAVLQRANGTADPILIWPPAGSVVAMGQLITIQMAVANATPLKRIEVMVDGNPAEGVDFTQQQGLTRTIVTLDFHMPAAGENTYGLSVRTTGWDNVQTVGPVLNLTLDGAPPSGNLIETMITDAGAYDAASGLLRFTGGAGDSMGLGNIATVQVAVGDGPLVDAHWNGDGSWQTMAYVGANPYGKLIPLTMRSVDKAGRITTDTHPVFINIAPPPGFDATKIPTLTIENTSTDEASGVAIFVLRLSAPLQYGTVAVHFNTANGTSSAGDLDACSGIALIRAGEISTTVRISITRDALAEADETFMLTLTAPTNANLGNAQGVGIIKDTPPVGGGQRKLMLPMITR